MRKEQGEHPTSPPRLMVPKAEAEQNIRTRIDEGNRIRNTELHSEEDLEMAKAEQKNWSNYNKDLLARLFDNEYMADEYYQATWGRARTVYTQTSRRRLRFDFKVKQFKEDMDHHIHALESILERVELIPEPDEHVTLNQRQALGSDVFIVHGHDKAAKETVARFVEKLGLHATILHEQPNAGRTIIEKFEDYSNVGFAVVLLTSDDIGFSQNKSEEKEPRARQNVIFELGYFVSKLGRNRVCVLHKEDVEIPSDFQGVLYVRMDSDDGWQLKLAKEIKNAGIEVDLNKL